MDVRPSMLLIGPKRDKDNMPVRIDIAAMFDKQISVTPLHMNLTQTEMLETLRGVFK